MAEEETGKKGKKKQVKTASLAEKEKSVDEGEKEGEYSGGRRKSQPGWSDKGAVDGKKSTMHRRVSMAAGAAKTSISSYSSVGASTTGEGGQSRKSVVGTTDTMLRSIAAPNRTISTGSLKSKRGGSATKKKPSSEIKPKSSTSAPGTNLEKSRALKKKLAQDVDATESHISKKECWKPVRSGRDSTILFSGCNNPVVIDDPENREDMSCRERTLQAVRHFCPDSGNPTNIRNTSPECTDSRGASVGTCRERSYTTRKDFHSFHCTTEIRPLWMHGLRDFDESGSDFLFVASSSFARKNDSRSEDMVNKFRKEYLDSENIITREPKKACNLDVNSVLRKEAKDKEHKKQSPIESSGQAVTHFSEDKSDLPEQVSSQEGDAKKSEANEAKKDSTSTKEPKQNS